MPSSRCPKTWLSVGIGLVAGACLASCSGTRDGGKPAQVKASLEWNQPGSVIEYVDYVIRLAYLEVDPPVIYYTAERHQDLDAPLLTVAPCKTNGIEGKNQLIVDALVKFVDSPDPIPVTTMVTFVCRQNADTPVTVSLTVARAGNAGFFDTKFIVNGTTCATKTDIKGDEWAGTCGTSSCGREDQDTNAWKPDSEGVFLFANGCQTVQAAAQGSPPTFFVCGDYGAEWVIDGEVAHAFFPIPSGDPSLANHSWEFGVVALDRFKMTKDPVLTDEQGIISVWGTVGFTRATFTLVNGMAEAKPPKPIVEYMDFAAILTAPPRVPGDPTQELLVLVDNQPEDRVAHVRFLRRRGPCDLEPAGIKDYPFAVIEVQRNGNSAIRLTLSDDAGLDPNTIQMAKATADCAASFPAGASEPVITCTGVTPINP